MWLIGVFAKPWLASRVLFLIYIILCMVSVEWYYEKKPETIADMISPGQRLRPLRGKDRSRYVLRDLPYNPMTGMGFFDHQSYEFLGKMDEIVHRGFGMKQVSGLIHEEFYWHAPVSRSHIPGKSRKVPFFLGNWIAGFKGKVDGN